MAGKVAVFIVVEGVCSDMADCVAAQRGHQESELHLKGGMNYQGIHGKTGFP